MKHVFYLLAVLLTLTSCEINLMQPDNDGTTVVPDMTARIARAYSLGGADGKTLVTEYKYAYNQNGLLERLDRYSRNASGKMELYAYETYSYNAGQQLTRRMDFSRVSVNGDFKAYTAREYSYPSAEKTVETTLFSDYQTGAWKAQGRIETIRKDNRPVQLTQYSLSEYTPNEISYSVMYQYQDGRLVQEDTKAGNGTLLRSLAYTYKGRTAQIDEFVPNWKESISEQKKTYDARGRLVREEVLKTNPLLCVAMVPGSATLYEYVD